MTTTLDRPPVRRKTTEPPSGRRIGYAIAIAINAAFLYIVHNLLEWDWVPFLTTDFNRVLGILTASLILTIAVNVLYLGYDASWFKSLTQAITLFVSLLVTIRIFNVWPFDFSTTTFNATWLARLILMVAIVGTSVAILVEVSKFIRALARL